MAEAIYKNKPFYLHHDLSEYMSVFDENKVKINTMGLKFLKASIVAQEKKESKIFEILGLDKEEWPKIGEILYGVVDGENNKEEIKNKLEFFLDSFTNFLRDEVLCGSNISGRNTNKSENYIANNGQKEFEELVQRFIDFYNKPIEYFTDWYNNKSGLPNGKLEEKDLLFLNQLFESFRIKRKKIVNKDNKFPNMKELGIDRAIELMNSSSGMLSNLIGALGEQATILFLKEGKNYIIKGAGTSDWVSTDDTASETKKYKNLLQANKEFYTNLEKDIGRQIKEKNIVLGTQDGNFKFGTTFSTRNTGTLTKNLKADEIFSITFKVEKAQNINFGISSKTSRSEKTDTVKVYSGSFLSAFENMFKSFGGAESFSDAGDTAEIINFLCYATLNSKGVGYYGNIKTDKIFGKEEINLSNVQNNYNEVSSLYNRIVQCYGYQWLTGGIAETTHADFFSLFGEGKHYFIPMSVILKFIFEMEKNNYLKRYSKEEKENFFSNTLFPSANKGSEEMKDNYNKTRTYDAMKNLALNDWLKTGGKEGTGAVNFNKGLLDIIYKKAIL